MFRVNLKPVNAQMDEMVRQRRDDEMEDVYPQLQKDFSPASGISSKVADGPERCAEFIPENGVFVDDADDDIWDCPFTCHDSSVPMNGTCGTTRHLSESEEQTDCCGVLLWLLAGPEPNFVQLQRACLRA